MGYFWAEIAKFAILTICLCTKKTIWDYSHSLKLKNGADNYFATEEVIGKPLGSTNNVTCSMADT
jgi:hypothetical protein